MTAEITRYKLMMADAKTIPPAVINKAGLWDRLTSWLHQLDTDSDLDDVTAPHKYRAMAEQMRELIDTLERFGAP